MKEKYQLLLNKVIKESKNSSRYIKDVYICNEIDNLNLGEDLFRDFVSRKPSKTQYEDFYNHELFIKNDGCSWWSDKDKDTKKSNEQRILFLKQIISEL